MANNVKPNKKLTSSKSAPRKAFDSAVNGYKKIETYGVRQLIEHAEKLGIKVENNIYPNLTAEEHRLALIESCIKTDSIFSDKITDKPDEKNTQLQNYMFYNQLYFLAIAQLTQPNEQGDLMAGLVSSLSMIAGAAIVSKDFRQNLKEHAEDALLKYVEPFKKSQPKLWQELSARVESHPGCESPEGIAIKLLKYQYQAAEAVSNGASTREMNELLIKKTAELKSAANHANISWEDVVSMHNELSQTMQMSENVKKQTYGPNWKNHSKMYLNSKSEGLGEKVGVDKMSFSEAKDWETPIDKHSLAKRLLAYQKQLQEAVDELHDYQESGKPMSAKYDHLKDKKEHELFADALDEVAELKTYAEMVLKVKWSEVAVEYDNLNRHEYDKLHSIERAYLGKSSKHDVPLDHTPTKEEYEAAIQGIKDHNNFMHYELPVDAASAGRCLKKYQQDAYENVRDMNTRHNYKHKAMDSSYAYDLANKLCQNVQAASKVLGFSWKDAVIAYRKDVYNTVNRDKSKSVIWNEITDKDVIAKLPEYTVTYKLDEQTGKSEKITVPLGPRDQIQAWDGALFDAAGNKIKDDMLLQVRNPFTQDEAEIAYTGLMNERNTTELEIQELKAQGKSQYEINTATQRLADIESRFDEMNKSLLSDRFTPDDIKLIRDNAMSAYVDQINNFTKMYNAKYGTNIPLDDSLLKKTDGAESSGPDYC